MSVHIYYLLKLISLVFLAFSYLDLSGLSVLGFIYPFLDYCVYGFSV